MEKTLTDAPVVLDFACYRHLSIAAYRSGNTFEVIVRKDGEVVYSEAADSEPEANRRMHDIDRLLYLQNKKEMDEEIKETL